MQEFALRQCQPPEGLQALSASQVTQYLARTPGWALVQDALQRRYEFTDYHHTMAFVNAVAWIAHGQDHHPDLLVGYGHCTVRFNTHAVAGISINDFICAAKVDALVGPLQP